jgi:hypothetical protein
MFIKLSNANPELRAQPIIIRKDKIITVFSSDIEWNKKPNTDDKVVDITKKETVTCVFCGDIGTWYVLESVDEVFGNL